jgi:AraC-like DNA-binding protein
VLREHWAARFARGLLLPISECHSRARWHMRIAQVAYMAGYTEPAALVRAFKRWTGTTPMKFRDSAGCSGRAP